MNNRKLFRISIIFIVLLSSSSLILGLVNKYHSPIDNSFDSSPNLLNNLPPPSFNQQEQGQLNEQLTLIDSIKTTGNKYELGRAYLNLSTYYRRNLEYQKSLDVLFLALELMQSIDRQDGIADAYSSIGMFYWRRSKFDSAIVYMKKGIEIYKKLGDTENYAIDINSLGSSYYQIGLYDKALSYYIESNSLRKKLNDYSGISKTYNNIGMIYRDLSYYEKAQEYFNLGVEWAVKAEDSNMVGYSYSNLGSYYESKGNLDSALAYFIKAANTYTDNSYSISILNQKNIGRVYLAKKEYSIAAGYLESALELTVLINDRISQAEVYKYLSLLNLALKNINEAVYYAESSLKISKDIGRKEYIKDNYKILADIYQEKDDSDKALDYFKKYHEYYTALFNQEVGKKISVLEEQEEMDKQRLELSISNLQLQKEEFAANFIGAIAAGLILIIIVLFIFNRKIQKANYELLEKNSKIVEQKRELDEHVSHLRQLGDTQSRLFSILAHDLRNPFHSMLGYSELLLEDFGNISKPEIMQYLKNIHGSLNSTYNLLVNLLMWSQANTGSLEKRPEKFDFNELVNSEIDISKSQLLRKSIQIEFNECDSAFVYADKNMIEIVFRNLITNAIKYSNNKGRIWISTTNKENYLECSVKDEGIGLDTETSATIFTIDKHVTRSGTAGEKGSGLGLVLCKEFVELNNGKIAIESNVDKGSVFRFTIPIAE